MNLQKQYRKIQEFIEQGEKIAKEEFHPGSTGFAMPYISGPMFEAWMNEIDIFNDRYLKKHPLHDVIHDTVFHHKTQRGSHKYMMGHLAALESDSEFWRESSDNQKTTSSSKQITGKETERKMSPSIFISHRVTDAQFADMIRDFLVGLGVPGEMIFCSSLPGNDVKEKISVEVKEHLKNSCLNIVILSKSYYESAYCLNEAGILWYNDTKVLPIALEGIEPSDMIGFLNDDYKIRRLNNDDDIAYIADLLIELGILQSVKNATVSAQGKKLKTKYDNTPQAFSSVEEEPNLVLYGIKEDGNIDKDAYYQQLKLQCDRTSGTIIAKIKRLYEDIKKIQIDDIAPVARGLLGDTPVKVHDGVKTLIIDMAEKLEILIPDDFFFVGSLAKPFNSVALPFAKPNYNGTKNEITKYELIEELYRTIVELTDWQPVEDGFKDIMCVRLAIGNNGVELDEDIDISLRIPQKAYMTIDDIPKFNEDTMEYIVRECDLSELLGIVSTAEYSDYDSTIKKGNFTPNSSYSPSLLAGRDYEKEYYEEVENALCYDVYTEGEDYIIKFKVEYLKHNSKAAFPAVLLLKEKIEEIPYEITSQKAAKIIKSTISVR